MKLWWWCVGRHEKVKINLEKYLRLVIEECVCLFCIFSQMTCVLWLDIESPTPKKGFFCVCLQHHRQISSTNEQVRYLLRSSDELRPLHLWVRDWALFIVDNILKHLELFSLTWHKQIFFVLSPRLLSKTTTGSTNYSLSLFTLIITNTSAPSMNQLCCGWLCSGRTIECKLTPVANVFSILILILILIVLKKHLQPGSIYIQLFSHSHPQQSWFIDGAEVFVISE